MSGLLSFHKHFASGILIICLIFASFIAEAQADFENYEDAPKATIDILQPQGFQVSIPHQEGISLFAFHGKLNEEMNGREAGTWARDIPKAKDGRWTFRDTRAKLKNGDILYYWTTVVYNGLAYYEDDGVFVVRLRHGTTQPGIGRPPEIDIDIRFNSNTTCSTSITVVNNGERIRCKDTLIFEDNFDGNQLNSSKWKLERRFPGPPDDEYNIYLNDNNQVLHVANGLVTIKPKKTSAVFPDQCSDKLRGHLNLGADCTGEKGTPMCDVTAGHVATLFPPYVTAQFSTKQSFTFKYGRIDIRAKLPRAKWVFPQMWLQPVNHQYGQHYGSGQIRIAFSRNDDEEFNLYGGVILDLDKKREVKLQRKEPLIDWTTGFHVYSVIWTETGISFLVDNIEHYAIFASSKSNSLAKQVFGNEDKILLTAGTPLAPFDQQFYITLGYGIGGNYDFHESITGSSEKPWRNTSPRGKLDLWNAMKDRTESWLSNGDFSIDYVRVYSL